MDRAEVLKAFDREQRRDLVMEGMRRETGERTVRHVNLVGGEGVVLWCDLDADHADAAIAAEVARFRALEQVFEWKHFDHDPPADLAARLADAGFEREPDETVAILDIAALPERLAHADETDIRRVAPDDSLDDLLLISREVNGRGAEWFAAQLAEERRLCPDRLSIYVAYADGEPASVAWARFYPGGTFASLWGGSTREAFRGRGLYTALVARRAREAAERGARWLYVDAGPMSLPILGRLGFEPLVLTRPFRSPPHAG